MTIKLAVQFVVLAALWGASFLFMRLGAGDFGPIATAGLRVGLAALVLLPLLLLYEVRVDFWRWRFQIMLIGLISSAIPFTLYSYAVLMIPTSVAAIINATVPLVGALIAWVWLQDRPDGTRLLGLMIGFVGVALLVLGKASVDASGQPTEGIRPETLIAMAAAFGAIVCYGIAANATRRYLRNVHSMAVATGSQIGAALGLFIPMIWFWPSTAPGMTAWLAVIALAVLGTALAFLLFFNLIARIGPTRALTVTFLVPVFAVMYAAVFLNERITLWMLVWGGVILLGTALSAGLWRLRRPPVV